MTCEAQEIAGGRWGCSKCDISWDVQPALCHDKNTRYGVDGMAQINRYRIMSMVEKLALFIAGPIDPVPTDSRYELEEIQLFAFDRLTEQERAALIRRAEAMERMLKAEHLAPDPPAVLMLRIDRVLRAPPDIWSVGDLMPLLKECSNWFKQLGPLRIEAGQLARVETDDPVDPPSRSYMLPVDKTTVADVLRLFQAFVIQNATVWQMGAGDHHHPIWEHVAVNVDGDAPTGGPEYAYIQPLNRKRLSVLQLEASQPYDIKDDPALEDPE